MALPRLGVPKGVCPLRGDVPRGLAPLEEWARQASEPSLRREGSILKQYVDGPSGEPARRQACHSGVSAVAVEAFVNYAG